LKPSAGKRMASGGRDGRLMTDAPHTMKFGALAQQQVMLLRESRITR